MSNILLVVAIDAAGMSLAFPVGVGLALVIGTIRSYVQTPKEDPILLFAGVVLIVIAMVMSALAYSKLPPVSGRRLGRGLLFAVIAGCLMGSFYPMLLETVLPDFGSDSIDVGFLTPYTALLFLGIGLLLSNFVVNTVFMKAGGKTYGRYFGGSPKLHSLGVLGGVIWMVALGLNGCGRTGGFLRPRPRRYVGGGNLGRLHLEGVQGRAQKRHSLHRADVPRIYMRSDIDRSCNPLGGSYHDSVCREQDYVNQSQNRSWLPVGSGPHPVRSVHVS